MKKIKAILTIILSALILSSCTFFTVVPGANEDIKSEHSGEKVDNSEVNIPESNQENLENAENNTEADENSENSENSKENLPPDVENGENNVENNELENGIEETEEKEDTPKTDKVDNSKIDGTLSAQSWIIPPSYVFDSLETFGLTGYSIYRKDEKYGILDMGAAGIGTGDYTNLFYCPEHGLSCPDISDTPIKLRDDLYLAPDCGYGSEIKNAKQNEITYVFDNTRDRIYAAGYSGGIFRLADITDTEFFDRSRDYIVVLYDCDADIMMYEGIGMTSLKEVFSLENKEMCYGVIDGDMDYVVACVYEEVRYGNDCYIVKQSGKYGYRAVTGRQYYPCVFEEANTAYKGAAWVKYEGRWGTVRF